MCNFVVACCRGVDALVVDSVRRIDACIVRRDLSVRFQWSRSIRR